MKRAILEFHLFRKALVCLGLIIICSLGLLPQGSIKADDKAPAGSCPKLSPEEIYARLKQETRSHQTYTAVFYHSTERGPKHEMYVHGRLSGKYLQAPAMWCEKRLELEASFPEQAGPGHQECYTAKDDMNRLLMTGAYRILGVITMFPEDPKASYLNGENMKNTAVWTWFKKWDRMREGGQLTARCSEYKGKPTWVLTIVRGTNPDPLYHHDEVRIFVDPDLWFPVRVETYVPDDSKPVVIYEFEEVKLDVGLTEADMTFEGLAPGWNLVPVPGGPALERLVQEEPKLQETPGLEPGSFLALLDRGLAATNDYTTDLTLELRYLRLRQYRQDQFQCLKTNRAFSAVTTHLETNYMLINSGEGFRTVYDPARDKLIHVLPAGMYRVMGEQTFPLNDPRLFSALGDDITDLNFFAIRDELKRRLDEARATKIGSAAYGALKGPWLEVTGQDLGIPAQPTVMRLMVDEKTRLPLRLEYRGYDDPRGYLTIRFSNTKINTGLKSEDLGE
ncbi:MAG TPA: hypothetical protein VM658_02400 [bacterium]|nr:hypothetical protein [bacterium]